jgi:hypothetical protein
MDKAMISFLITYILLTILSIGSVTNLMHMLIVLLPVTHAQPMRLAGLISYNALYYTRVLLIYAEI